MRQSRLVKKTVKCRGCGSYLYLQGVRDVEKPAPRIIADHLSVRPACAREYGEMGLVVEACGKLVIPESLHVRSDGPGYAVAGVAPGGEMQWFGRYDYAPFAKKEVQQLLKSPLVSQPSSWRG